MEKLCGTQKMHLGYDINTVYKSEMFNIWKEKCVLDKNKIKGDASLSNKGSLKKMY